MATKAVKHPAEEKNATDTMSLQISLPQLLNLALSTPEVGTVNLNILHNFLHVLLHLISLESTRLEYRGEHANRIKSMLDASGKGPSLQLQEYNVTDGAGSKATARTPGSPTAKTSPDKNGTEVKKTKGTKQQIGAGSDNDYQKVILVEPVVNGVAPTALTFKHLEESVKDLQRRFQALEELQSNSELMERLKGKIKDPLTDVWQTINISKRLDANEQGIDKLMSMVQDLARGGISQLPTENDATKENQKEKSTVPTDTEKLNQRIKDVENAVTHVEQVVSDLQSTISQTPDVKVHSSAVAKVEGVAENVKEAAVTGDEFTGNENPADKAGNAKNHVPVPKEHHANKNEITGNDSPVADKGSADKNKTARNETRVTDKKSVPKAEATAKDDSLTDKGNGTKQKPAGKATSDKTSTGKTEVARPTATKSGKHSNTTAGGDLDNMREDIATLKTEVARLRTDVQDVSIKLEELTTGQRETVNTEAGLVSAQLPDEAKATGNVEKEANDTILKQCLEMIENIEKTHAVFLDELNDRVSELEKEISASMTKSDIAPTAGIAEDSSLNELVGKIQAIQTEVNKFNKIADRLMNDRETRETHMNAIIEQIELLKTVKADKEDLEDALVDKADVQIVERKVSHDRFDAACDDLAKGLEDAIAKLGKQESIWQEALDEVQREIEGKVDKIETTITGFVSDRLKALQEKLKKVAEMKEEKDAAGTKKILRDVRCISCDKNVIMKMQEVGKYHADPLPCSVSMKPYLTYELDQVRKQQRRLPHGRNMLTFEAALQEGARKLRSIKDEVIVETPRDHLCNRYCGGSHTITTPQQRIMRMGHFLPQWGPEVVQLNEGAVHRSAAQMYQSGPPSERADICGPCCEIEETAPKKTVKPTASLPTASVQRKSQQSKRSGASSRRRSSRKSSGEPATKAVPEPPPSMVEEVAAETEIIEDVLPIDPTAHDDQIIRDDDEFNEEEIENETTQQMI